MERKFETCTLPNTGDPLRGKASHYFTAATLPIDGLRANSDACASPAARITYLQCVTSWEQDDPVSNRPTRGSVYVNSPRTCLLANLAGFAALIPRLQSEIVISAWRNWTQGGRVHGRPVGRTAAEHCRTLAEHTGDRSPDDAAPAQWASRNGRAREAFPA